MAIKPMSGDCYVAIIQWASSLTVDLIVTQQREVRVARLPCKESVIQMHNEVMKENCNASPGPFSKDVLYYKRFFPEISNACKVEAFGRLTLANLSKILTRKQEIFLCKIYFKELGRLLQAKWIWTYLCDRSCMYYTLKLIWKESYTHTFAYTHAYTHMYIYTWI